MDEFLKFVATLPNALDEKEQEFLLYEYAKTRDPKIREKLIIHNQLLCAHYAMKYCRKHNLLDKIDEVYSDCIVVLVKAVDAFEIRKGASFATFACSGMENYLFNNFMKWRKDALYNLKDVDILDKEEEDVENGLFTFLFDEKESEFHKELAGNAFVEDIYNYINSWKNKKCAITIMIHFGLNGYKKASQDKIASELKISRSTVVNYLNQGQLLIKKYIAENYPNTFPDIYREMSEKKVFDNVDERNEYIVKRYFGIDCTPLTSSQIAEELGETWRLVNNVVAEYRKSKKEEGKEEFLIYNGGIKACSDEMAQKLLNSYYGLGGDTPHSVKDLMKLHEVSFSEVYCRKIIKDMKDRALSEGKYSKEDFVELDRKREEYLQAEKVKTYEYLYNSFYGLNGCERKTCVQLSHELGAAHTTVLNRVHKYAEYLESIKERESAD